jgi:hypothetical protein
VCIDPQTPGSRRFYPEMMVGDYDETRQWWEITINQRVAYLIWEALMAIGNPDRWTTDTIDPDVRTQAVLLASTFETLERAMHLLTDQAAAARTRDAPGHDTSGAS